jgi:3-isopropylmalate dehydrogenase
MLLRYSLCEVEIAEQIERAVSRVLSEGFRTKDIHSDGMNCVGTNEMGDAVVKALASIVN